MAIADGTMEKRDCLPSLLEQKHISLFYCNSRKAILNPHQHGSETKFRIKFLHALLFSKSGQFASAVLRSLPPHTPEEFFGEQAVRCNVK